MARRHLVCDLQLTVDVRVAPPIDVTRRFRHFSCPECQGALEPMRDETTGMSWYLCRIGHRYVARELLVGKELQVERTLWCSLTQLDELLALLDDLEEEGGAEAVRRDDQRERYTRALRQREQLETVIAENVPVQLQSDPPIECDPNSRLRQR